MPTQHSGWTSWRRHQRRGGQAPHTQQLRIAQGNVGKRSEAHTTFLQLCWENKVDVALVQEPWSSWTDKPTINTHPGYDSYTPVDSWDSTDTRPRVMTYTRKGAGLETQQLRPTATRDILWLEVSGCTIANVYRPLNEPDSQATTALLDYAPPRQCVVAGDFNA